MMAIAAHHIGQLLARFYLDHRVLVEPSLSVQDAFELDIVETFLKIIAAA